MTQIITADNYCLELGRRAFNYYDMKAGTIVEIDSRPQPDTMKGQNSSTPIEEWDNYWFTFLQDDGSRVSLDGSRIVSMATATKKGWI